MLDCCQNCSKLYEMSDFGFNRGYIRRIQREMVFLNQNYEFVESTNHEETKSHVIRCLVDNWHIEARIPQMYPFKAPQVFINQKHYRYVNTKSQVREALKANGIECLCCRSMPITGHRSR